MTISPPPCRLVEHADLGGVESDLEEVEVVLRVDAVALRDVGHDEPVVPELQLGLLLRREDGRAHSQVLNVGAHVGKETERAWVMFSDELHLIIVPAAKQSGLVMQILILRRQQGSRNP